MNPADGRDRYAIHACDTKHVPHRVLPFRRAKLKQQAMNCQATSHRRMAKRALFEGNTISDLVNPARHIALCILLQLAVCTLQNAEDSCRESGPLHSPLLDDSCLTSLYVHYVSHSCCSSYFELQRGFLPLAELRRIICTFGIC
jgi:hypothetical protein